ncbi:MAG: hypothetical protein HRT68_08535 [Flavobacteriaceae bacterium]|nr:hypothetical protein [Flavobacteriaceae bacterium]
MRILVLLLLLSISAFGQSEYAVVNLYRINAVCSSCAVAIKVNDEDVTNIQNRDKIELKFKRSKEIVITISGEKPKFLYQYTFQLEKGKVYYYNVKPRIPRAKGFKIVSLDDSLLEYEFTEHSFILD